MKLKSFRIINCFGFRDSGPISLENRHNLISVLGRNSSGKTSLLRAIEHFEYGKAPESYPNFNNFNPTVEEPRLVAEFAVEAGDFSLDTLINQVLKVFRQNVSSTISEDTAELERLVTTIRTFYEDLLNLVSETGVVVEKTGNGTFRFLTDLGAYEDYNVRKSGIDEVIEATSPGGQFVYLDQGYHVGLYSDSIENYLFLQFPKIVFFGEEYSLTDDLPERITPELLSGDQNSIEKAFISYLGADTIRKLLGANDPEDRSYLRRQLQEKADILCGRVNRRQVGSSRGPNLVGMVLDEHGGGLQITIKTDEKPSFYNHMSDNTKFLLAYNIHQGAQNLKGDVLLFDEPNTGFHATAQEFVLGFLKSLGQEGSLVVLSTHSEHMIDLDLLSGVRIMTNDGSGGIAVSNRFYESAKNKGDHLALQPVLDAIGLRYGSQINIRDRVVVTEGISDMLYLRVFKRILGYQGDLNIAPARSESQILSVIPLLISQGISFKVVMDTGSIRKSLQDDFGVADDFIWEVPVPETYRDRITGSGIEDLFSKDDFKKLLGWAGITVLEEEFDRVTNGRYMKDRGKHKGIVAHRLYEQVDSLTIQFDEETRQNFHSVLSFCTDGSWFSI